MGICIWNGSRGERVVNLTSGCGRQSYNRRRRPIARDIEICKQPHNILRWITGRDSCCCGRRGQSKNIVLHTLWSGFHATVCRRDAGRRIHGRPQTWGRCDTGSSIWIQELVYCTESMHNRDSRVFYVHSLFRSFENTPLVHPHPTDVKELGPINEKIVELMGGLPDLSANLGSHVIVVKFHGANLVQPIRRFGYRCQRSVVEKVSQQMQRL